MSFVRIEHANTLVFGLLQCLIVETPVSLLDFVLWLWDFISLHEMKFFISCKERKSCDFSEYCFGKLWFISLQKNRTAQRLLPPHLSAWHPPCAGHLSKKLLLLLHVWLGLKKTTKLRALGTLQLQKACQGENGTAPTLLPPDLSAWPHPFLNVPLISLAIFLV